ncbi:hypothetical protein GH5_02946 [Leishmania sp. Ghana 2012 LV757]|uniref:hypothetical protein n=1 Tax=Leishmania sp. Ghana 2012 LV757 TaxID=2803181 RepID=UPI001B67FC06|nr:hypothetical protein GH5_02946 [Leishmania sp. Ghana 2012 LV757]
MALQENKDSYEVKALSLTEFVLQCADCQRLCLEKTARVLENRSRAPRGWESVFDAVAEERRTEDFRLCESRCRIMHTACPSRDKVRQYEEVLAAAAQKDRKGTPPNASVLQEASRCEHAVETMSSVLFTLAHKPSKVSFPTKDLKAQDTKYGEARDTAPTEAHRKALGGAKAAQSALSSNWSKLRPDHLDGDRQHTASPADFSRDPKTAATSSASGATTPRW